VKTGEDTFISLKKTLSQVQPSPYGACNDLSDFDSDIYKFMVDSNRAYRQYDCLYLCLQQVITKKCGCYYTRYPMFDQAKACLNKTELNCTNIYEQGFANGYSQRCLDKCPLECESVTYDYSVSTLDFPSREFYETFINDSIFSKNISDALGTNGTFDLYKENFLSLNVFLSSNKYTKIMEMPKISLIDLISGIGGSIGIFLGFSMFSLIEVLELLFQVLIIIIFKKRIH
jgi:amiloride-sensitive sodium channel subunit alpha